MERLLLLLVVAFDWIQGSTGVIVTPVRGLADGSQEYTMFFQTPNISIINENLYLCVAAPIPDSLRDSYIMKIVPNPDPESYAHINVVTCEEPGLPDPTSASSGGPNGEIVWDCGSLYPAGTIPPLVRGSECSTNSRGPFSNFVSQWQSGSVGEDTLKLPDGMGIPVRGRELRPKYLIGNFHYPSISHTKHNTTGVNGIEVTLVANPPDIRVVDNIDIFAIGFVAPESVEVVTATWTLDQDIAITPVLIYTHWHASTVVSVEVWRQKRTGEKTLILRQDPRSFMGVNRVNDASAAVMEEGDKISLSCTFNNTTPRVITVMDKGMCVMNVAYSVAGKKTLDTAVVYSADTRYYHCFKDYVGHNKGMNFNDEGHNDFAVKMSESDCFSLARE